MTAAAAPSQANPSRVDELARQRAAARAEARAFYGRPLSTWAKPR